MKEKIDLIDLFCLGKSGNFAHEGRCLNFEALTGDCMLLQGGAPLEKIFIQGRCTPEEILQKKIIKYLLRKQPELGGSPTDHEKAIRHLLLKNLKKQHLEIPTLPALIQYLKRASINEITSFVKKEGLHASLKNHVLYEESPDREKDTSGHRHVPAHDPFKGYVDTIEIGQIIKILKEREQSRSSSANKRQFLLFVSLLHCFKKDPGITLHEALSRIAKKGKVTERTLYRDLDIIQEYLQKKCQ